MELIQEESNAQKLEILKGKSPNSCFSKIKENSETNTPLKDYHREFNITPIRRQKRRSQVDQMDYSKVKDTPELFRIDGRFSQFHTSNSKWNQQNTPVQMGKESLFKLNDFLHKKTPELYPNRKNSVMTELIKSAAIEESKEKNNFYTSQTVNNQFYIPEENSKISKSKNYFENDIHKIREEQNDNMSFNSAFENNMSHFSKKDKEPKLEGSKQAKPNSYYRVLFPLVHSPQNMGMFQSPINVKNSKDKGLDMMLECKDFFERSYSKILQSQKKNMDNEKSQQELNLDSDINSKFMIQNFLNSSQKSNLPKNKIENQPSYNLNKKRFSFCNNQSNDLLNIPSQIGPNLSRLGLTSSISNSINQDSFLVNSLNKHKFDQNDIAEIILDAKNGIEKNIINSPIFSRNSNQRKQIPLPLKNHQTSSGFYFNDQTQRVGENSFCQIPEIGELSNQKNAENSQNKYTIKEIKDALNSNSKGLLSNYQGSLSSLSNKKYIKFSNSDKNKKVVDKKSSSGSKKDEKKEKRKRNKSSTIINSSKTKKSNSGLLFGNSSDQMKFELKNSLVPINTDQRFYQEISYTNSNNKKNQNIISPFSSTFSPFFNSKQMPSTARNTISHLGKNKPKNHEKVKIGHFTTVSMNPQISLNYPYDNKFQDLKNPKNNLFSAHYSNKRMETPDPVGSKLGKRGGSDAKKCQTPSSFLASDGKDKKKIRNM